MLKKELSLLPAEKPDQAPVNMLLLVLTAPLLLWPTQEQRSINPLPVAHSGQIDRLRLDIYPDGGMARFRAIGRPDRKTLEETFSRTSSRPSPTA